MKETLTTGQVADRLLADKNANWTPAGARAIAEHIEECEVESGEEMELDVIAIRCEFTEYESALDAIGHYAFYLEDEDDEDEALEWLQDRTTVIEFSGGIIIQDF